MAAIGIRVADILDNRQLAVAREAVEARARRIEAQMVVQPQDLLL